MVFKHAYIFIYRIFTSPRFGILIFRIFTFSYHFTVTSPHRRSVDPRNNTLMYGYHYIRCCNWGGPRHKVSLSNFLGNEGLPSGLSTPHMATVRDEKYSLLSSSWSLEMKKITTKHMTNFRHWKNLAAPHAFLRKRGCKTSRNHKCAPWRINGAVLSSIGDACPILPFMGKKIK